MLELRSNSKEFMFYNFETVNVYTFLWTQNLTLVFEDCIGFQFLLRTLHVLHTLLNENFINDELGSKEKLKNKE